MALTLKEISFFFCFKKLRLIVIVTKVPEAFILIEKDNADEMPME